MRGNIKRLIFIPLILLTFSMSFVISIMPVVQASGGLPEPEFVNVSEMNAREAALDGAHSSLKYSAAKDGIKSKDGKTVKVWFTRDADSLINVRFESNFPVAMVYVKNNAGGNLYTFSEAVDGASGLIAPNPQNTGSGKNHVTFYFSNDQGNPEPQPVVYKPLKPVLEYVQNNGDNTYTAHWGYLNENDTIVDAKASYFTGNRSGGTTEPPINDFEPGRVRDAFQTVFDGTNLVWTLTGPDGSTRTATASAQNAKPYEPPVVEYKALKPVLEYVQTNSDGSFTAHWGYMNENEMKVDAKASYFTGNRSNGTMNPPSEDFEPGRVRDAFQTVFDGTNLVWTLTGPDGTTRTATASAQNAKPYEPPVVEYKAVKPVLEYVQTNSNGSFTAHWGYMNENEMKVNAKASYFTGNRSGGTTEPPINDFEPGRVRDAFQTIFDGTNLVWTLTGPDGTTRTATASSNNAKPYIPPEDPDDDDSDDNNNPPPTNNEDPGTPSDNNNPDPSDSSGQIDQPTDEEVEDTSAEAEESSEETDEITLDDEAIPEGSLPKTGGLPSILFYTLGMSMVGIGFKLRKRD